MQTAASSSTTKPSALTQAACTVGALRRIFFPRRSWLVSEPRGSTLNFGRGGIEVDSLQEAALLGLIHADLFVAILGPSRDASKAGYRQVVVALAWLLCGNGPSFFFFGSFEEPQPAIFHAAPTARGCAALVKSSGHSPNFIEQTAHCDHKQRAAWVHVRLLLHRRSAAGWAECMMHSALVSFSSPCIHVDD